jgi:hypothetical protein
VHGKSEGRLRFKLHLHLYMKAKKVGSRSERRYVV